MSILVTSGPITADAATAKVVGIKKTFTVSASATNKVTGLSKAEKKIVKVTKKGKKFTIKGLKAGKATFKIGKKSYTVKVGATTVKAAKTKLTLTKGKAATLKFTTKSGNGDTLTFKASNKNVTLAKKSAKIAKSAASVKATAKKAGKTTITATSKATGKKATVTVTVKGATKTTATPVNTATPEVTATATVTGSATNTPEATGAATTTPEVTNTPEVTSGAATTTPEVTNTPEVTSGAATATPEVTNTPEVTATAIPTATPEVATSGSVIGVTVLNSQEEEVSASAVPATGKIKVVFSEAVNEETVNVNTIRVFEKTENIPVSIPASQFVLSADKKTAYIDLAGTSTDKGSVYKVVINGVKTATNKDVIANTTEFIISKMAVVTSKKSDKQLNNSYDIDNNVANGTTKITIGYDELLDESTITTSNVTLVDVKTGERVAITLNPTGDSKGFIVGLKGGVAFTSQKQYILAVNDKLVTAVGNAVEAYTCVFAVGASTPLAATPVYSTIDGKNVGTSGNNLVWPNIEAGMKEGVAVDTYYAGLNIVVKTAEKLDAASVAENVQLVEKETKAVVDAQITYNSDAQTISIIPKANLKEDTSYLIEYKGGLKTDLGIYLVANKKDKVADSKSYEFKTMDITAPTVTSITSEDGLTNLKKEENHTFIVTFSEDIPLDTVASSNIVVAKTSMKNDDSTTFGDIVNPSNYTITKVTGKSNTYAIKILKDKLAKNQAYKIVVVGKDLKDAAIVTNANKQILRDAQSNSLAKSYTITFTTEGEDVTGPNLKTVYRTETFDDDAVVTSGAITNVTKTEKLAFKFNEKIKADTINPSKIVLQKKTNGKYDDVQTFNGANGAAVTSITTAEGTYGFYLTLPNETTPIGDGEYRVIVKKDAVEDLSGNKNTEEPTFDFVATNGDDKAPEINVGTITETTFTAFTPTTANVYEGIPVSNMITVCFYEDEITDIPTGAIKLTDADGKVVDATIAEIGTNVAGLATGTKKAFTITPKKDLSYNTSYTVTVDGIKDVYGNKIAKNQFQFKTVAAATKVTAISIANAETAVDLQKTITVTLNNKASLTKATAGTTSSNITVGTYALYESDNASNVPTYTAENDDSTSLTFKFTKVDRLKENTNYTLVVYPSANNKKVITFTTGRTATDDVKPSLVKTDGLTVDSAVVTPNEKTYVNVSKGDIVAKFDEKISKSNAKVTITNTSDGTKTVSVLGLSLTNNDQYLNVSTLGLVNGANYKVVISGIEDEAGNKADDITFYIGAQAAGTLSAGLAFAETTKGVEPVDEVLGVYKVKVTANATANDTIAIANKTLTAVADNASGDQFNIGANVSATVTNIVVALQRNMPNGYTVTVDPEANDTIVLTQTAGNGNANAPTVTITGSLEVTDVSTITSGVTAVVGAYELSTLTAQSASTAGYYNITIAGVTKQIVLDTGDDATAVATKIYNAFNGSVDGYTLGNPNGTVTFTATTYGDKTDLTVQ